MRGITLYLDNLLEERERERKRRTRTAYASAMAIALVGVALALRPHPPAAVPDAVPRSVPAIEILERFGPPAPALADQQSRDDWAGGPDEAREEHSTQRLHAEQNPAPPSEDVTESVTEIAADTTDEKSIPGATGDAAEDAAIPFGRTFRTLEGAGVREISRHLCVSPKWIRRGRPSKSPERVTISNPGDEAVTITRVAMTTDRRRSGFSVDALGCRGRTLQPGERCTIAVTHEELAEESMEVLVFTDAGSHAMTVLAATPPPARREKPATRISWWRRR